MTKRLDIFIEATPLLDDRLSGIGHSLDSTIRQLSRQMSGPDTRVTLVAPIDKMSRLKHRTNAYGVSYKAIPLPARALYLLWKFDMVPPLDLWLGKGVYIFPNFRNWPLLRSKSITYVHDLVHEISPEFVSPPNQRFLQKHLPKWLARTDIIVAVSEHTKRDIVRIYKCPEGIVKVIHNGVELDRFSRQPLAVIAKIKEKYQLPKKYLMFFSTLEPRKNVDGLLDAYISLPPKIQNDYGLLLVGAKGWLVDSTIDKIKRLQSEGLNIIWPQAYVPDEDLPALLSGAAALVHPAFYEGFGISPLQAMACKTPVIVARNSSIPEVVGDAGLYFDADDSAEISSRVQQLLDSPKLQKELAAAGYQQARKFTWQRSALALRDIIEGIKL